MSIKEAETKIPPTGGRRVTLHMKSLSPEATRAMAGSTLQGLLDEEARVRAERLANPKPGDAMPDGSVCAGRVSDGTPPLFATPADAPEKLYQDDALAYVGRLNAEMTLGHDDWRLPTDRELKTLFNNRAAIGLQETDGQFSRCYWSTTTYSTDLIPTVTFIDFKDGKRYGASPRGRHERVRAVRGG